jgi:putative nucleotidyltransferase with HDIG domain
VPDPLPGIRLGDVGDLPTIPALATRALAISGDYEAPIDALLELLRLDPPSAAKVLRVANTVWFQRGHRVTDLRAAVVRLGFAHVRNLLVGVSVLKTFDRFFSGAPYSREDFWKHSIGVGIVAARLGREASALSASRAFLAGLLHDIGKLVLDRRLRESWDAALRMARQHRLPLHEAEARVVGCDHATLGGGLLDQWRIPAEVADPVRAHHQPDACPLPHRRVAMLLQVADVLCIDHRIGYGGNEHPERPSPQVLDALRLTDGLCRAAVEGLDLDPLFAVLLAA